MKTIEDIKEQIKENLDNVAFTQKGWEPIFMASKNAKIVIIGQAPGIKTQEKGAVFMDKSGDKLREWMGASKETFYESGLIAVLPLDFYFPGKGQLGDLPPRKDFAQKWHPQLLEAMPDIELTILIGKYAIDYYLPDTKKRNLTETVKHYKEYLPTIFPLVHPSPLNFRWHRKNPDFEEQIIPHLKEIVSKIISP